HVVPVDAIGGDLHLHHVADSHAYREDRDRIVLHGKRVRLNRPVVAGEEQFAHGYLLWVTSGPCAGRRQRGLQPRYGHQAESCWVTPCPPAAGPCGGVLGGGGGHSWRGRRGAGDRGGLVAVRLVAGNPPVRRPA